MKNEKIDIYPGKVTLTLLELIRVEIISSKYFVPYKEWVYLAKVNGGVRDGEEVSVSLPYAVYGELNA